FDAQCQVYISFSGLLLRRWRSVPQTGEISSDNQQQRQQHFAFIIPLKTKFAICILEVRIPDEFVYTVESVFTSIPIWLSLLLAAVVSKFSDEGELIARLRSRDPDALAELYDRYSRVVFSLIVR